MKEMIVRGLQQAYENMVHMIAEFLPHYVVRMAGCFAFEILGAGHPSFDKTGSNLRRVRRIAGPAQGGFAHHFRTSESSVLLGHMGGLHLSGYQRPRYPGAA